MLASPSVQTSKASEAILLIYLAYSYMDKRVTNLFLKIVYA